MLDLTTEQQTLIHRYLDGQCSEQELQQVNQLLIDNPRAMEFLVDISEHAIAAGDLLSIDQIASSRPLGYVPRDLSPSYSLNNNWIALTLLAMASLLAASTAWNVFASMRPDRTVSGTIKHAHGLLDLRGYSGDQATRIESGQQIFAGDILESKSCDSWLEIDVDAKLRMTLASHSSVRMLSEDGAIRQYELQRGGLWVDSKSNQGKPVRILTPTATIDATDCEFNVRVTETTTVLWVHQGQAVVRQAKDGQSAEIPSGFEATMSLEDSGPLSFRAQSVPIHHWALKWPLDQESTYGRILSNPGEPSKLKALPMLWPIPNRAPLLLYVSAIGAWKSSPKPIIIRQGSVLRFRGRTLSPHTVRFGFSTQKHQGLFGGKFEVDVSPDQLGPPDQIWQVDLGIDKFRSLYPQLNAKPDDLQLIDVYALTVQEDVGLDIYGVELIEPLSMQQLQ
ncbi:MAG: FecR family protein [Pirellula sp.]|jgi:hypothetical protein